MALFGNWAELTVTNDVRRYGSILEKLDSAGIAYREKIQQLGHGDRRMGNLGAGGGSGVLYQVFVRKTDLGKRPCFFFVEWWNTKKRATVLALFLSS